MMFEIKPGQKVYNLAGKPRWIHRIGFDARREKLFAVIDYRDGTKTAKVYEERFFNTYREEPEMAFKIVEGMRVYTKNGGHERFVNKIYIDDTGQARIAVNDVNGREVTCYNPRAFFVTYSQKASVAENEKPLTTRVLPTEDRMREIVREEIEKHEKNSGHFGNPRFVPVSSPYDCGHRIGRTHRD